MADLRYAAALADCRAGAVLVPADYGGEAPMPVLRRRARAWPSRARWGPAGPDAPEQCARPRPSCRAGGPTLGASVWIGAYTVLGEDIRVGAGTAVHAHCPA